MADILSTSLAYKTLKGEKSNKSTGNPGTLKESIFSKPLTWALIAGGVGYMAYRLLKEDPSSTAKKDAAKLEGEGQVASYLDSAYKGYADSLYNARIAANTFGTNEDAIYSVFQKMKNDLDIVKLIAAFGERRLSYSLQNSNLAGFLTDELDTDELNIINTDLRSRKINYQF